MSVSWRSESGKTSLHSAGEKGEARIAVDSPGERATSERLTVGDLKGLETALKEHLVDEDASWSSGANPTDEGEPS